MTRRDLSRFMRKTLLPDEELVGEARFSFMYTVSAWAGLFAFAALGAAAQYAAWRYLGAWTWAPTAAGAGVGAWQFFWMMMKKWTTEIVLTDHRLIYKTGFFLIRVQEVDIEQLASDNVEQSLLGRWADYGALHIRCIEASDFRIPPISDPYGFRNLIESQKRKYRDEYMKIGRVHGRGNAERKAASR